MAERDLGDIVNKDLKFEQHMDESVRKASK